MAIPKNKSAGMATKPVPAAKARKTAPVRTPAPVDQPPAVAKRPAAKGKQAGTKPEKRVRSSFSMPDSQFAMLAALKARCLAFGVSAKKGELLAAGLHMLANLPETSLEASILPFLRTGQKPPKDKKRKK
ncbi:MAG: hypothetical protein H7176_10410 [Bdellovibrionales bacterium]|nr:hypothetical protein [Massilia sp.]